MLRHLSPFPQGMALMVLDFAENFTCSFQDEVQAAHWYHEQVTVHPIVTYHQCLQCQEVVTESLVFISPDRKHDYHAVHHFTTQAIQHLRHVRGLQLDSVVQFTDGCASQYKSRGPFADIACGLDDHQVTLERHFFGSRHGKGPSDGESAVVKSGAARAVKGGGVTISNAEELFGYLQSSSLSKQPAEDGSCRHNLRSFFYVGEEDVLRTRNRPGLPVAGTRKLHAVRGVEGRVLMTRPLSCFCPPCRAGVGQCINIENAGRWEEKSLGNRSATS